MKQPYWLIRGSLIAAIGIGFFHAETVAQSTHGLFLPTLSRSYAPVTQPPLVPLGTEEWTQEAHDAQRTGYSPINPATPWTLLYTFNASDSQGGSTCPNNDPTKGHCYNAAREAHTVTGSLLAMALTISTQTFCAGLAPLRHTSVRSGQPSQQRALGSNSPGRRKPSALGREVRELAIARYSSVAIG